jgi:hypothetical protein
MDWLLVVAGGLYFLAVVIVAVRERAEDWSRQRTLGMALFLVGVGGALFLDDLLTGADGALATVIAWSEPFGAAIMLAGGLLVWTSPDVELPRP